MFGVNDYLAIAKEHEDLFREILRDMREHRKQRRSGSCIPSDIDTELPVDELFQRYSSGNRHGQFTITNFTILGDEAEVSFQDVAIMSGGGATWSYKVYGDSVEFTGVSGVFMS